MSERKWIDQAQPQTLQAATLFCYLNAALAVFYLLVLRSATALALLLLLALAGAAYGIANERRLAWWAAIALSGLYLVVQVLLLFAGASLGTLLNLLFAGVLFVLLVHPQSRQYQKIWFH
ncbi:MAG: hypothetical protein ACLP9C_13555 [Acidimicrobiales bacterium]